MNIKSIYTISSALLKYYLYNKRTPLTVSYLTTYRCNQKCRYCNWQRVDHKELTTSQSVTLIEQMKQSGVVKLGFAGGESLYRDDIEELLECSHKCGLITSVSSNGRNISKHIDAISKYVDVVQLSVDGMEDTHDEIRGKGSFKIVLDAIRLLKQTKTKVISNTVISNKNIKDLPYILMLAEENKYRALFQPVFFYSISEEIGAIRELRPSYIEMYYVIEYLKEQKKKNMPVGNSIAFFNYVQESWDKKQFFKCHANNLFCSIDPMGYIMPCCFDSNTKNHFNAVDLGFGEAFLKSESNDFSKSCNGCYCNAYIESTLAFSFNISACINAFSVI